jgi:hypothetical protein
MPCAENVDLSKNNGSIGAIRKDWAIDRRDKTICRQRHGALVEFIDKRDSALLGLSKTP